MVLLRHQPVLDFIFSFPAVPYHKLLLILLPLDSLDLKLVEPFTFQLLQTRCLAAIGSTPKS